MGFKTYWTGQEWVITQSKVDGIMPGDIIKAIDDIPIEEFYQQKLAKYIQADSERDARRRIFQWTFLLPQRIRLTVNSGKQVEIDWCQLDFASEAKNTPNLRPTLAK